jgi:hypothetical protein
LVLPLNAIHHTTLMPGILTMVEPNKTVPADAAKGPPRG